MQKETILDVMVKDHDRIIKLLNEFEECLNHNKKDLIKSFEIFKWDLEKHIFTEEKVVFTSYDPEDYEEGYKMIPQLMQQHDKIYTYLKEIEKIIRSNKKCDFKEFKEFFLEHKEFEEEYVYPRFDNELDEKTKEMVIKRINEIKSTDDGLGNINVTCSECGKKIGILHSYYNLKFRKRWIFCSECYDKIEKRGSPIFKHIKSEE